MPIRRTVSAPETIAPVAILGRAKFKPFFRFTPHPYTLSSEGVVSDDTALECFWMFLSHRFREATPVYRICEVLDIHRCVVEEWLDALSRRKGVFKLTPQGIKVSHAGSQPPLSNLREAVAYDPWVDRDHDQFMQNYYSCFPWFVIDKYYLITTDEVKRYTGQQRIRPDGRPFSPRTRDYIDPDKDDFASFHHPNGWQRSEWPKDRYDELCEAASRPQSGPRRGGLDRRISAQAYDAAARERKLQEDLSRAAEARIDRCGVRGHHWLEDFCRRAPTSTSDKWFISALAEEGARKDAEIRWANVCHKFGYDPCTITSARNTGTVKAGVRAIPQGKSQSGAKLLRRANL